MNDTEQRTMAHIAAHDGARYTAQEIADSHSVGESTIRTRWFQWINRVAPADLLKDGGGYTELARVLFGELASCHKKERAAWVTDARSRYEPEWSGAGIIDGELMPEIVGGQLALMHSTNRAADSALAGSLAALEVFADQLAQTEASYTAAELDRFRAEGVRRGLTRFQISAQAEVETLNALRNRRAAGGQ